LPGIFRPQAPKPICTIEGVARGLFHIDRLSDASANCENPE
jgi:hypothetical protein